MNIWLKSFEPSRIHQKILKATLIEECFSSDTSNCPLTTLFSNKYFKKKLWSDRIFIINYIYLILEAIIEKPHFAKREQPSTNSRKIIDNRNWPITKKYFFYFNVHRPHFSGSGKQRTNWIPCHLKTHLSHRSYKMLPI